MDFLHFYINNIFGENMKRNNAAAKYYRKNLITMIAFFVPVFLLVLIVGVVFPNFEYSGMRFGYFVPAIIIFLTFMPFIIYYLVKFLHYKNAIFRNISRGKVVDCETFNRGRYGTFVGFYVVIESDFETKKVLTKHCHSRADGYLGNMVEVGQDVSTGEWIILE